MNVEQVKAQLLCLCYNMRCSFLSVGLGKQNSLPHWWGREGSIFSFDTHLPVLTMHRGTNFSEGKRRNYINWIWQSSMCNALQAKPLHCLLLWLYLQVGSEGREAKWQARPMQNVPYGWQAIAKAHLWEVSKKGSKHCCVMSSTAARICSWI